MNQNSLQKGRDLRGITTLHYSAANTPILVIPHNEPAIRDFTLFSCALAALCLNQPFREPGFRNAAANSCTGLAIAHSHSEAPESGYLSATLHLTLSVIYCYIKMTPNLVT